MTELKCPFCKKELELIGEKSDSGYPIDEYVCSCPETVFCFGNTVMWHKLCVLQNQLEESREDRKRAEKELIRTRKALGYAIDVIQTVAKMSDKLSREYGETLVEQLDNIQAYCWQEGYILTHREDLERAITALEQKDVKCQQEQI